MEEFAVNLMLKFIRRYWLSTNLDDLSTVKGIKAIFDVELWDETVSDIDTTKFPKDCVKFYANTTNYLIQNPLFNERLIQHAKYILEYKK